MVHLFKIASRTFVYVENEAVADVSDVAPAGQVRHEAMERRRSERDALEQAHSDELAFLRKFRANALTSLTRMRGRSVPSSSPWPFVEADDDDEDQARTERLP